MTRALTQIPPLMLLLSAASFNSAATSCSAASIEWRTVQLPPTKATEYPIFTNEVESLAGMTVGLSLIDLANAALADSRPMTAWEREVTDDFFWSQFS